MRCCNLYSKKIKIINDFDYYRLSFIWKTPIGYIAVMIYFVFGDITAIVCVIPTICFCLGSGWLLKSFIEDIRNDLSHLHVTKRVRQHNERELEINFCKIVQLYTNVKKLRKISFIPISSSYIHASFFYDF